MVLLQAKKDIVISRAEFMYVFRKDEIREIPEEHAQILLSTGKIKQIN